MNCSLEMLFPALRSTVCRSALTFALLLSIIAPVVAGDTHLTGVILSSSTYQNNYDTYGVRKAYDNDSATFFHSDAVSGWVGIDLGPNKTARVTSVTFTGRAGYSARLVGGRFQGANTANFTGAVDLAPALTTASDAAATVTCTNTGTFRYLRFLSSTAETCNMAELAFYGVPNAAPLNGTVIGTDGSYNNDPNRTKAAVFDGFPGTFFDGPVADGCWAGIDLGEGNAERITVLRYFPRFDQKARLNGGIFQGANLADFTDAVSLYTVTVNDTTSAGVEVAINAPNTFRYLRYLSPNGSYGNIGEAEFIGQPLVTLSSSPAAGTVQTGERITITATFSSQVVVTGTPQLTLTTPAMVLDGTIADGRNVNFTFDVTTSIPTTPAIVVQSLSLNGGTINDTVGNPADLTGAANQTLGIDILAVPPSAPTGLTATAASTTAIDLRWTDTTTAEDGFRVYRATASGGPWTLVATLAVDATTYQDTGLTWRSTYFYQVSAFNVIGASTSNEASATTNSNTAPVIVRDRSVNIADVARDAPPPAGATGTLLSSILTVSGDGTAVVTDGDPGAVTGIAVTSASNLFGLWYYSVDNGATWMVMPAVTSSSAYLLPADTATRLYFHPSANWTGTAAIRFVAWDRSTGTALTHVHPTPSGGTTAFSTEPGYILADVGGQLTGIEAEPGTGGGSCGLGSGLTLLLGLMLACCFRVALNGPQPPAGWRRFRHLFTLACIWTVGPDISAAENGGVPTDRPAPVATTRERSPLTLESDQQIEAFLKAPPPFVARYQSWVGLGTMPTPKSVEGFSDGSNSAFRWGNPWRLRVGIERLLPFHPQVNLYVGAETGLMSVMGQETFTDQAGGTRHFDTNQKTIPLDLTGGWRWNLDRHSSLCLGAFAGLGATLGAIDYSAINAGVSQDTESRSLGLYMEAGLRGAYLWAWERWGLGLDVRWNMYARSSLSYDITETYNLGTVSKNVTQQISLEGVAVTVLVGYRF